MNDETYLNERVQVIASFGEGRRGVYAAPD